MSESRSHTTEWTLGARRHSHPAAALGSDAPARPAPAQDSVLTLVPCPLHALPGGLLLLPAADPGGTRGGVQGTAMPVLHSERPQQLPRPEPGWARLGAAPLRAGAPPPRFPSFQGAAALGCSEPGARLLLCVLGGDRSFGLYSGVPGKELGRCGQRTSLHSPNAHSLPPLPTHLCFPFFLGGHLAVTMDSCSAEGLCGVLDIGPGSALCKCPACWTVPSPGRGWGGNLRNPQ